MLSIGVPAFINIKKNAVGLQQIPARLNMIEQKNKIAVQQI